MFMTSLTMAASTDFLLSQLSTELINARALPLGVKTFYQCPATLDHLKGISYTSLMLALPKPDYESNGAASYFLTSPVPPEQKGGGFPEITFIFDSLGVVEKVTCFYSK
jgi:hypothetical protein